VTMQGALGFSMHDEELISSLEEIDAEINETTTEIK
jgi:hypothetical protein